MADVQGEIKNEELQGSGFYFGTIYFTLGHADLTAAATSEALDITLLPADAHVYRAEYKLAEYFTGGAVSACTVAVGDADPDAILNEVNIFDSTTRNVWAESAGVETEFGATGPGTPLSSPVCTVVTTDANVSVLDAGSMEIVLFYKRYDASKVRTD